MKLLLDAGLPRSAATLLAASGIDCIHTSDAGLDTADDADILLYCRKEGPVMVTLDADFHAALALSSATSPSVIRIHIEGLRAERLAGVIERVLNKVEGDLRAGAVVAIHPGRFKVRRLPLIKM